MRKLVLLLSFAFAAEAVAQSAADSLQWRNVGPTSPGRMTAVAGSVARPDEYYMGSTGAGVYKTTDGGRTAVSVTDPYFGGTIGAVAVAESNPDIVYVGGGETPIRGNVSHGEGVWKSTDGGKTWTSMGLRETQYIGRIRLHPTNPDVVYVAALGHVFGPNRERGVYKSVDGGRTWRQVKFVNDSTGAIDLVMDPKDPNTLYASFWEANRRPWALKSGGPGSAIFKTTDGGETWTDITRNTGLPSGLLGNIGLSVSPINSNIVWAMIENEPGGGLYKSSDAGRTWTRTSDDRNIRQRAWYYSKVYASPIDTQQVVVLNVSPMWSNDGGKTFRGGFGGGDNHDMWWAPDGKRMAVAHDHGTTFTADSGRTRVTPPMANAQMYHAHLTNHAIPHVCGAQQDASSVCGPIRGPIPVPGAGGRGGRGGGGGGGGGRGGAPADAPTPAGQYQEFYGAAGGESGYMSSSPLNPDITYGANYGGSMTMRDRISGRSMALDIWPLDPMGHDVKDSKYRFQWTYPIVHSPHDPRTIYVGSNVVFKSTDEGMSFTAISPDLTRHDPRTMGSSGGPISKDQTSVEYYATVFTISESPIRKGVIWTGSDDGKVFITRNGGATWTDVTPKGIPEWMRMSIIDASPHSPGTAWLAGNRYQLDDFTPYLYRTNDYGQTWVKITDGIPATEFTRAIREDLARPGMVYAATERGMYVSYDYGRNWESLKRNLPPVPVHDIALKGDDMAIATHGRSFWVMERLDLLRNAPDAAAAKSANRDFLYQPPLTPRASGNLEIRYDLAQPGQLVTFELSDASGKVFKKVSSADSIPDPVAVQGGGRGGGRGGAAAPSGSLRVPNAAGTNRYVLNLRYPSAPSFQGMILWNNNMTGPLIAPGQYRLTMRVANGTPLTKQVRITRDPRADATDADVAAQTDLALRVVARLTDVNNGVRKIRSIERQLDARSPTMESNTSFRTLARNLRDSLNAVEDSLYQTKNRAGQDPLNFPIRLNDQLGGLNSFVQSGERKPTRQSLEVYDILAGGVAREMRRLRYIETVMLPRVNASLKAAGQEEIVPTTDEPPPNPDGGRGGAS